LKQFSVIVPNYNSPVVDRTIKSLEQQSFDRDLYEIIVVGTDRYGLVRGSDLVRFDRTEQRLSPAAARNRGAAQASGEILVFIDADCIARSDWLSVLAERFTDSRINVMGGSVEFETANYWTLSDNLSMFHEHLASCPPGHKRLLPSLNLAVRRAIFQKIGGFDERYPRAAGEDADLTVRLRLQGHALMFEPRAVVLHYPARDRLVDLWQHGFYQGKYSIKVDPRFAHTDGLFWPLRTRPGVLFAGPLLATLAAGRVIARGKGMTYWYTFPALWIAKLAWCMGAACRPRGGVQWGLPLTKNE
jgi:glycosyltransferase involved in cell wall biosynthesis